MLEPTARVCEPSRKRLSAETPARPAPREPRRLARAQFCPAPSALDLQGSGGDRMRPAGDAAPRNTQDETRWRLEPEAQGGHETVLVVEDEQLVRDLVREMLSMHGYNVLVAESPQHALDVALSGDDHIDLLLADVVMPQMSGLELWERAAPHRPDMRVLFMSGYADNVVSRRRGGMGKLPLLEKPFTIQALAQAVRNVLDTDG